MSNPVIDTYSKRWYNENGKLHREDGPAIEFVDGYKEWCLNGKLHREDGPAVEKSNGTKYWYLNGVNYSEQEFNEKMKSTHTDKEKNMSNPEHNMYGDKYWYNGKRELHREDGPAIEYSNGIKYWWLNGELHREDGPAIEYENGDKEWWLNGVKYSEQEFNEKMKSTHTDKNPDLNKLKMDLEKLYSQFENVKSKISRIESILEEE